MQKDMRPEQVQAARQRLGLTQEELAHKIGVTVSTVNRWECGRSVPHRVFARLIEQMASDDRSEEQ